MTQQATPLSTVFESVHLLDADERRTWYAANGVATEQQNEIEQLLHHAEEADADSLFTPLIKSNTDDLIGEQIGPYQVKRLLGSGGMGSVYLAERIVPYFQQVAIKIADIQIRSGLERFQAERQLLAELQHSGIARILDGGVLSDKRPYLVMEYVPGEHIDVYAEKRKLRVMERVKLWMQVCEAVAAAHERGIVHRDLKPSNILVTDAGRVVVVDFGLARRWEEESGLTKTSTMLGTPEYMAPEQAGSPSGLLVDGKGKPVISPAADVYSLGAVLYLLLCGRPPFRADSTFLLINQLVDMEPVSPRRLNQAVSRDLETVCLHCLKKVPSSRYLDARDLWEESQRLISGQPIHAKPTGALQRGWLWAKRRPAFSLMGLVLLATIITSLVAIGFYWRKAYYSLETAKLATVQLFEHAMKLTNEPGMQKAQVELLSKAIRAYGPLVRTLNDVQITLQYLNARRVLLESTAALGDRENEELLSEELLRDTEAFVKAYPLSSEIELEWALALRRMGNAEAIRFDSLNRQEHLQASLAYQQQAEAILKRLSARHPERDSLRGYHAEIFTRIAVAQRSLGLESAAESNLSQARIMFKQLYEKYPQDPQALIRYCQLLFAFADNIEFQADKDALYGELLEESYQLDVVCQSKWPDRHDHRTNTSPGVYRLARWLERKGDWERARNLYVNLNALGETLMAKYPDVLGHIRILSETLYCHGNVCFALGRTGEAKESFLRSFRLSEMLLPKSSTRNAFELFYSANLLYCPIQTLCDIERAEALLSRYPNEMATRNDLYQLCHGMIRLRQNRLSEARDSLTKALALRQWNVDGIQYRLSLALVHAKLGEVARAKDYLDQTKGYFQRYPKDILLGTLRAEVEEAISRKR